MLRTAIVFLLVGGNVTWGQEQRDSSADADNRAAAYYHFAMTVMYAKLAAASRANPEYLRKAIENREAAIKADPAIERSLDDYLNGAGVRLVIRVPAGERSRQQ
jgi:hypothetical protein